MTLERFAKILIVFFTTLLCILAVGTWVMAALDAPHHTVGGVLAATFVGVLAASGIAAAGAGFYSTFD